MPAALSVLEVVAEPTRRRLLDAVRGGERSVGELVEAVGMHQPGVSRHLKVLRDAGLVEVRRDAQRRLYRIRPEPLMEIDAWLEPYRAEWTARLDSLDRHLARTATPVAPTSGAVATEATGSGTTATEAAASGAVATEAAWSGTTATEAAASGAAATGATGSGGAAEASRSSDVTDPTES